MDRALKERIIGAVVLVALVVLVVPVFLDGPPEEGEVRTERVPLPGQDEQETQTVVLERNRSEPLPAQSPAQTVKSAAASGETSAKVSTGGDAPASAAVPEPAPARPPDRQDSAAAAGAGQPEPATSDEPAPREAATPAIAQSAATGMFAVQLGSFSSKENAERLAAELRKQGFAAFLSQLDAASGPLHRVRVGPQKDRQAAEAMAQRLAKAGHKGQVVPHP